MRLFVSAGEASGDLHGASLLHAIQRLQPGHRLPRLRRRPHGTGRLSHPLPLDGPGRRRHVRVLSSLPRVPGILKLAGRLFQTLRPDALVLSRLPRLPLVAGQVRQEARRPGGLVRAAAAVGLGPLPRQVDAPPRRPRPLHAAFRGGMVSAKGCSGPLHRPPLFRRAAATARWTTPSWPPSSARPGTVVALLPGSRRQEIKHNFAADGRGGPGSSTHGGRTCASSSPACAPEHAQIVEGQLRDRTLPIEVHAGRTAEIIHLAHSVIAKSGSVGLELLYHGKPAVVVYQLPWMEMHGGALDHSVPVHQPGEPARGQAVVPGVPAIAPAGGGDRRARAALAGGSRGLPGSVRRTGGLGRPRGGAGRLRSGGGGGPGGPQRGQGARRAG